MCRYQTRWGDGLNRETGNAGCFLDLDNPAEPNIRCIDEGVALGQIECGDGIFDIGEACDDGNSDAEDGRSNTCVNECGDGVVGEFEACDDGNTIDGDGCDSNCRPTGCGNGVVSAGCDGGPTAANCRYVGCGNGIVEGDEARGDGDSIDGNACSNDCTESRCGDGIIQSDELCDDGNLVPGCNEQCQLNLRCLQNSMPRCASSLPFGPYAIEPETRTRTSLSRLEIAYIESGPNMYSGNQELYRIQWTFDEARSLKPSSPAIADGINVQWAVTRPNLDAINFDGVWRFSFPPIVKVLPAPAF